MLRTTARIAIQRPLYIMNMILSDPREAWSRVQDKTLGDLYRLRGRRVPTDLYSPDIDWDRRFHEMLGCPWPCDAASDFWDVYRAVIRELEAKGLNVGPQTYGVNNDGDAGLVRAIWCFVRHKGPSTVVETGVGHGMTSRMILEAMDRNGKGHLWSIDKPPREPELRAKIGMAVTDRHRHRWTLLHGTSRRHLPGLISRLRDLDLFVHDSLHTDFNVRFELDRAWPALRAGAAIVVDDIDSNWAFHTFSQAFSGHRSLICEAEPTRPDLRRFNKKGLFGILVKDAH